MAKFKAFKPQAMERIARSMGYTGDMSGFRQYLDSNVSLKNRMKQLEDSATEMSKNGSVRVAQQTQEQAPDTVGGFVPPPTQTFNQEPVQMQQGGVAQPLPQQYIPQTVYDPNANIQDLQAKQAQTPSLPTGATIVPQGTLQEQGQMVSPWQGQLTGAIQTPIAQATTTTAGVPVTTQAAQVAPTTTLDKVLDPQIAGEIQAQAQQTTPPITVQAQTGTESAVSGLQAAQGVASQMQNPVQRQVQQGELVSGAANAETASTYAEQIQAATATPTQQATVAGQLEGLMQQFEGGNTPAWAAGAMRNVTAQMAKRGLGASSMAGQALVQAAMESALPIAMADAQTQAQFEGQNLSNRQQRAMLAAQQRASFIGMEFDQAFQARVQNASKVSDVANMNFNAEQQVALENSRAVNTMNLNNLSNRQAMTMAEASALANMDMSNLNNRQQAAVQNAQNFLQTDMANLSNRQQSELFNAQTRQQSLFTDQAAINASQQFNATSENQLNQFFSQLQSQVGQFNSAQANAQSQYNAGQANTIERFNAELNNQREQFNAQNRLVIDQGNAQWRRQIATADTAAINRANELNATALLGLSNQSYNNLWQHYGDVMEWAWTSSENNAERVTQMAMAELDAKVRTDLKNLDAEIEEGKAIGGLVSDLFFKPIGKTLVGGIFGL